jgi:4-hydroxyphenylpyruvate dioxygenase
VDAIAERGIRFMPGPPEAYYDLSHDRVKGHAEPLDRMKRHGILIDGEGVVDGGETRILLQIFSKTVIGPIFFEFIQRKGDDGFGEGNFKALFESIEAEARASRYRGGRSPPGQSIRVDHVIGAVARLAQCRAARRHVQHPPAGTQ